MASANIAQRTSPRPARKPDPARIVQSYIHICDRDGKRHAFQTTAQIYGISHMTVRRIVERHETAQNATELPEELRYEKPPGGYDPPIVPHVDIATLTELSQPDEATSEDITSSDTFTNEAGLQETTNDGAEPSQPEPSQIHSAELETLATVAPEPSQPVIIRQRVVQRVVYRERERVEVGPVAWVREHPSAAHQAVAWLIAAVLIGVASLG